LTFLVSKSNLLGYSLQQGGLRMVFGSRGSSYRISDPANLWVGQTFGRWALGWGRKRPGLPYMERRCAGNDSTSSLFQDAVISRVLARSLPVESLLPAKAAKQKGGEAKPFALCHPPDLGS
jgi:hypothetical protein